MNVSLEVGSREHEIVYLRLCLRAPSFNNAGNVISVSQALITITRTQPDAEGRLCWFDRVGFVFYFCSFETVSPYSDGREKATMSTGSYVM